MKKQTSHEMVKHRFTPSEISDLCADLVDGNKQLRNKEDEKALISSQYGAAIKTLKAEINDLVSRIDAGFEMRRVECEILYDWKAGTKTTIRLDTGECVSEAVISAEERQLELVE